MMVGRNELSGSNFSNWVSISCGTCHWAPYPFILTVCIYFLYSIYMYIICAILIPSAWV